MADIEMKIEAEADEFTDELSDEALDREGARVRATVPPPCIY